MAGSKRRVLTVSFAVLTVLSGVIIFLDGVSVGAIFSKYEQKFSPANTIRVMILVFGVVFGVSLVGVGATVVFGAWRQNRPALMTGTVLLTFVSLAEFICGVVLFGGLVWNAVIPFPQKGSEEPVEPVDPLVPREHPKPISKCQEQLATRMLAAFIEAYNVPPKVDENGMLVNEKELPSCPDFDQLQTDFQCCGMNGSIDYFFLAGAMSPRSCCNSSATEGNKPRQRQALVPWLGQRPKQRQRPMKPVVPVVPGPDDCMPYEQGCVAPYFRYWRAQALQFAVLLTLLSVVPMLDCVGTTAMLYGLSSPRQPRR